MKRALCGLVLLLALAAAGQATASIATANVPHLAWRGQQVKVVACDIPLPYTEPFNENVEPTAALEAWTGDTGGPGSQPQFLAPASVYPDIDFDFTGDLCVSAVLMANKPGLAVVELRATEPGIGVLFKKQVLVVWMTLGAPVLVNLGGESAGNGVVSLGGAGDVLKATLKGTFPLGDIGPPFPAGPPTMTLPDDWAMLANLWAADPIGGAPDPGSAAAFWDIHDDTTPATEHVDGICGPAASVFDAVDSCLGGDIDGPFSRADGSVSGIPARGPYDPLRFDVSWLGDGKLDADDAPMPAARLDVSINAVGIGSLEAVDKGVAYSRDGIGGADVGNLFAPFYASFVPATAADPNYASGTHAGSSNNYPGFFGSTEPDGSYRFWRVATELETGPGPNACRDPLGSLYPRPTGARSVVLYTDEHGEARIRFVPGVGLWLEPDQNRCDLAPAPDNPAQVTAQARYPGDPVLAAPSALSGPVSFQRSGVRAGFSVTCMPKPGSPFPVTRVCFARVLDVFGSPTPNAQIRFTANSQASPTIQPSGILLGGFDSRGQQIVDSDGVSATIRTNAAGTAGVDVFETSGTPFQVVVEALGTRFTPGAQGVTRFVASDPSVVDSASGTPGPGGSVSTGSAPSPSDPIEATVTTPTGGTISIAERIVAPSPETGYLLFGRQIEITAPPGTSTNPLQLTFLIDASLLGGADPSTVAVFRNGVALPDCAGAPGTAFPEPACVAARTPLGGGAQIDVLAVQASVWWLGIRLAPVNPCAGPAPAGAIVRGPGNDTINGTSGDDVIFDTGGSNKIDGRGGDDTICTGSGNDKIDGGSGDDTIDAGEGINTVDGGGGNDQITTGSGNDKVDGSGGDDTIDAGAGNNTVDGGGGNDQITTGSGNDKVDGSGGDDTIDAGAGNNTVDGGGGNDQITTGSGNDKVDGSGGADICRAGGGNDKVKTCETMT